jgi:DNA-binding PadR family transcriptional regulator
MDTRTICLGVLTGGEATGYEIKKHIEENFGHFLEVSHSSIYPALADLHRESLVSCREVRQEGKPDKKVYSLTDSGREAFVAGLMRSPGRHRVRSEFVALMLYAEFMPLHRVRELLDERIADFESKREYAASYLQDDADCQSPGSRFAAGLAVALMNAGLGYIREHRRFLEDELANGDDTDAVATGSRS